MKRNKVTWAQLTLALNTELLLSSMNNSNDRNWPSGLAWKVVEKLKEKYQLNDRVSRVELRQKLNRIEIGKTDNPSQLFEQIVSIKIVFPRADK